MSTNCIQCVTNKRTDLDLLCDSCREEKHRTNGTNGTYGDGEAPLTDAELQAISDHSIPACRRLAMEVRALRREATKPTTLNDRRNAAQEALARDLAKLKEENHILVIPKDHVPKGANPLEAWETETHYVIIGAPNECDDETDPNYHNCDAMGCGTCTHVIARVPKINPAPNGVALIAAERQRQISQEGWTPSHDVTHTLGQMAGAAACYALLACGFQNPHAIEAFRPPVTHKVRMWPWADSYWKPAADPIRNLVKAGALIAAEIDRLQRAATSGK